MNRYAFDVTFATDKDALRSRQPTRTHRVTVQADDCIDAQLLAEQIVACHGEPVDVLLVNWNDDADPTVIWPITPGFHAGQHRLDDPDHIAEAQAWAASISRGSDPVTEG